MLGVASRLKFGLRILQPRTKKPELQISLRLREIFGARHFDQKPKRSSNLSITGHPNGWLVLVFGFFLKHWRWS
jgi:hypothetical protein